jgi:23S rRNA pseudoU1915 N3-methylase RlmH
MENQKGMNGGMMIVDKQFESRIMPELKHCSPKQGQVKKSTERKRKTANKMCRIKKKKWLNDKIMRTEENHKKNETRKFFEGIKNTRQQGINTPILVTGSDGNIISQIEQVLNRWREYFCQTLNLSDSPVEQILIEEIINENQEVDTPSYNKICYIINNL